MSTFSKHILLCLFLLGIPSAAFAHGPPMDVSSRVIFVFVVFTVFAALILFGIFFLLFRLILIKKYGVVKTSANWWQCFALSIVTWIVLFIGIGSCINGIIGVFSGILSNTFAFYLYILNGCLFILLPFLSFYISHKIIK